MGISSWQYCGMPSRNTKRPGGPRGDEASPFDVSEDHKPRPGCFLLGHAKDRRVLSLHRVRRVPDDAPIRDANASLPRSSIAPRWILRSEGASSQARRTLIWLDPSSPRRQFFLVGLGAGTVLIVPAPRPPSRLGDVRALFRLSRLISWLVPEGIPLEKAKGTGRVRRRYDG